MGDELIVALNAEGVGEFGYDFKVLRELIAEDLLAALVEWLACKGKDGGSDVSRLFKGELPCEGIAVALGRGVSVGVLHGGNQTVTHTDVEGRRLLHYVVECACGAEKTVVREREGGELVA